MEKVKIHFNLIHRIAWAFIVLAASVTSVILLWISWKWNALTPTTTVIYHIKWFFLAAVEF